MSKLSSHSHTKATTGKDKNANCKRPELQLNPSKSHKQARVGNSQDNATLSSPFAATMVKFWHKTGIRFLFFLWIVSSVTYFLLFKSFLRENSTSVVEEDKLIGPKPPTTNRNLRSLVRDPWKCGFLDSEISSEKRSYAFTKAGTSKTTSYCLAMMESFDRCVGFVEDSENPSHLLRNPFLESDSKQQFLQNADKYRSSNIYFVHVMKSSGTSIEGVLRRLTTFDVGGTKIKFEPVLEYYCSNMLYFYHSVLKKPNSRFIALDKRSYGLHRLVPTPGYYVTILRNPVDRFVSMYYYIKQNRYPNVLEDQLFEDVFRSKDLDDFLEATRNKKLPFFDNHIIRMFQFDTYPEVFSTFSGGPDTYIRDVTPIVKVNQSHYQEALRNLRNCAFVGITEQFEKSQKMLEKLLDLRPAKEIEVNVNRNYHKKSVTSSQRDLILPRVQFDLKLYEEAKLIFDRQLINYDKMFGDSSF